MLSRASSAKSCRNSGSAPVSNSGVGVGAGVRAGASAGALAVAGVADDLVRRHGCLLSSDGGSSAASAVSGASDRCACCRLPVQALEAALRGFEHEIRIGSAGLQHLHVVLDRDDRIRHAVQSLRIECAGARTHDARERAADALHRLDGTVPAQHQQPGGDAAHQLRHLVQSLRLGRRRERMRDRLLDARHVHDALAQHGVLDLAELLVGRLAGLARFPGGLGQDQLHQLRIEPVLDLDQRRGDVEKRGIARRLAPLDDAHQ